MVVVAVWRWFFHPHCLSSLFFRLCFVGKMGFSASFVCDLALGVLCYAHCLFCWLFSSCILLGVLSLTFWWVMVVLVRSCNIFLSSRMCVGCCLCLHQWHNGSALLVLELSRLRCLWVFLLFRRLCYVVFVVLLCCRVLFLWCFVVFFCFQEDEDGGGLIRILVVVNLKSSFFRFKI